MAVLVSVAEFARMRRPGRDFWSACQDFRRRFDLEALAIEPDEIFAVEHG